MAEEKKVVITDAKAVEEFSFLIAGLILLGAVFTAIMNYVRSFGFESLREIWNVVVEYFLANIWPIWKIAAFILSVAAIYGIIHYFRKINEIDFQENQIYNKQTGLTIGTSDSITEAINEKWQKVLKLMNSNNPSDWRLAIMEADVMLDELLRKKGYAGETLGDMLKSANKNDFITLDEAWEAHKIRNAIAHTSGDHFQLNERETKRVISLYEKVFKEFGVIQVA